MSDSRIVEIDLNELGFGTVKIDGHDLAKATRKTTVITEVGEPTRVILELWAHRVKANALAEIVAEICEAIPTEDSRAPRIDVNAIVDRVLERISTRTKL